MRIAALVLALAVAAAAAQQAGSVLLTVELPDRPASGARLFAQKGCMRCHSIGGVEPRIGPDLGRLMFQGTVLDLAGDFWNHAPVMREKMAELKMEPPPIAPDEMADLVAYLTAYRYYATQLREPGNPALGRNVFVLKGCAGCHEGSGAWERRGPNLQKYQGRLAPIFLAQAMWNHAPEMASAMKERGLAWPTFSGREMTDLTAYIQEGLSLPVNEPVYFEPGSPRRGRQLFTLKRCIACHAIAGRGGRGGPDLGQRGTAMVRSVPELAGSMWNHSLGMLREFERRGIQRVTFSGQEMADIIAYLYFVNYATVRATPARGGQLFVAKCSACHALGRESVGPDLLAAPSLDAPIGLIAAMWNHASGMGEQYRQKGVAWPRFEPGETADLAAFLIERRTAAAAKPPAP